MALVSLATAKAWLRVSGTAQDALISGLVASLQRHFENEYDLVIDQDPAWSCTFDGFSGLMVMPASPIDPETIVVTYLDPAGTEQALSACRVVRFGRHHLRLLPAIGTPFPVAAAGDDVVTVTATAGWAENQVPADIMVAAQLGLACWFDNRHAELPQAVCDLLDGYLVRRA